MKIKTVIILLISISSILNAQNPIVGILNHSNSYFVINPFDSSYDDGTSARLFYDGNNKLITMWNSDSNTSYTNIKVGDVLSLGKIGAATASPKSSLSVSDNMLNLDWTNEYNWGGNASKWRGFIGFNSYRKNNDAKDFFFRTNNYTKRMVFEGGNNGFRWLGESDVPNPGGSTSSRRLTELMTLRDNGNAALFGKFEAKEIKVTLTPTADFVFEEVYNLPSLESVEKFVRENKHLPEIASGREMTENGVNVGKFQIQLLQKIEELTLYTIEQEKMLNEQAVKIKSFEILKKKFTELELRVENLKSNE